MAGEPSAPVRDAGPVELGQVLGAYGVKGWVRIRSYTTPPEAILGYAGLRLRPVASPERSAIVLEGRRHGRDVVARLEGIADRDAAETLGRAVLVVDRSSLPPAEPGQYYWRDLLGLEVWNLQGEWLGRIDHFIEAPANPVMVVRGEREHWLPLVPKHLKSVDLAARKVVVDWETTEA
ncbi:MAG: ribosome maturation factor RimM [Rhodospirillaceae bacterium]